VSEPASNLTSQEGPTAAGPDTRETDAQDQLLVGRAREGDAAAFGLLVAKYQDRLFNVILRMVGNRSDAEELTQEAFLRALRKLDLFDGRSRFYTWMFRVAVNLTISQRRRRGRVRPASLDAPRDPDDESSTIAATLPDRRERDPQQAAGAAETARRLTAAIEALDEEFRTVVVLRDIERMDYETIATVLDVPLGTVKSRLFRARRLLRKELADLIEP